jgi:hypothetical protein
MVLVLCMRLFRWFYVELMNTEEYSTLCAPPNNLVIEALSGGLHLESCDLAEPNFASSIKLIEDNTFLSHKFAQRLVSVYCLDREGTHVPVGIQKSKIVPSALIFEPISIARKAGAKIYDAGYIVSIGDKNKIEQIGQTVTSTALSEVGEPISWDLKFYEFKQWPITLCPLRPSVWSSSDVSEGKLNKLYQGLDLTIFRRVCTQALKACLSE